MDYLDEIIDYKRQNRPRLDRAELERAVSEAGPARPFLEYLGTYRTVVIAECKKASPSRGILVESYDPENLARIYETGGASAISVLTDEKFFQGSLDDLKAARAATEIPILRKDFTLDETDLLEARAAGADMVLLIARVLDAAALGALLGRVTDLGMDAVVEVHDEADIDKALNAGSRLIGINNRDLATFRVDLAITERLMARIPSQISVVSESGIFSGNDVARVRESGVRAVLVGEALIRAADTAALLQELVEAGCPDCWPETRDRIAQPAAAEPIGATS